VPELPEVDSARAVIAGLALDRRIVAIEDVDSYVCRPHSARELQRALLDRRLSAVHRRGKLIWCETSDLGAGDGPLLGLHLGMGGRLVVTDGAGAVVDGGDSTHGLAGEHKAKWDRFTLQFADGSALRLVDKRRLGRAVLDPDVDALGPDALAVSRTEFQRALGHGRVAVKARLLDQSAIAGIGNLIADEVLWQSRISPRARVGDLSAVQRTTLHKQLKATLARTMKAAGAHAGRIVPERRPGGHCPRCGAPMQHGVVGGRSTWWCEREQA
jgi:formamidopyrimidine-DNA glycosylase